MTLGAALAVAAWPLVLLLMRSVLHLEACPRFTLKVVGDLRGDQVGQATQVDDGTTRCTLMDVALQTAGSCRVGKACAMCN